MEAGKARGGSLSDEGAEPTRPPTAPPEVEHAQEVEWLEKDGERGRILRLLSEHPISAISVILATVLATVFAGWQVLSVTPASPQTVAIEPYGAVMPDVTAFAVPLDAPWDTFPFVPNPGCSEQSLAWLRAHGEEVRPSYTIRVSSTADDGPMVTLDDFRIQDLEATEVESPVVYFECPDAGIGEVAQVSLRVPQGGPAMLIDEGAELHPFAMNLAPGETAFIALALSIDELSYRGKIVATASTGGESRTLDVPLRTASGEASSTIDRPGFGPGARLIVSESALESGNGSFYCEEYPEFQTCTIYEIAGRLARLWDDVEIANHESLELVDAACGLERADPITSDLALVSALGDILYGYYRGPVVEDSDSFDRIVADPLRSVADQCGQESAFRVMRSLGLSEHTVRSLFGEIYPGSSSDVSETTSEDFFRYQNPRFGFSLDVPATMVAGDEPADGDGRRFTNSDGSAEVAMWGANNALGYSAESEFAEAIDAERKAGSTITYQHISGNAFTLSGVAADGRIYYVREIVGAGSIIHLSWAYPASDSAQWDPAVERSVMTIDPGIVAETH